MSRSSPQSPDEDLPAPTPAESPPARVPERPPAVAPPAELSIQATDDGATVAAGSSVVIDVLKNDRAAAGGQLTIVEVSPGESGQTTTDGRQITYTHAGSESSDRFTYQVRNAAGQTATATVSITVAAADSAPPAANRDPVAIDHYFEARPGEPLTIDLLQGAYDPDPNDIVSLLEIAPLSGSGQIEDNGDGTATYKPSQNGADGTLRTDRSSFKYTVTDGRGGVGQGTVFITVVVPTVN